MVKNILLRAAGWEKEWGLKLTSVKVEVGVEAELGNLSLFEGADIRVVNSAYSMQLLSHTLI